VQAARGITVQVVWQPIRPLPEKSYGQFPRNGVYDRAGLRLFELQEAAWDLMRAGVLEGLDRVRHGHPAEGTGEEAMPGVMNELSRTA